jgi:outer membrane lipoprotein-sorting protein
LQRTRQIGIVLLLLLAQAALSSSGAAQAAQGPWTLDTILKQLDRVAGDFRSLTADVERTKVTVVVNDRSTESGQVMVRRDDKMRIDLTVPDPQTILRDGDHFYIYKPKIRQVEEYDLGKHRALVDEFLLLGFGTSGQDLKKSYLVTLQGEETLDGAKVVRLELTPKADDVRNEIAKIDLWLDEATWLPAQQQFYENGTQDYFIIRYTHLARNVNIPDSRFKPRWPSGTSRIKPQS